MLQLSDTLTNVPVMSLRTGGQIATALEPIINPTNLKIEGWYYQDRFSKGHLVLLSQDVRDIIKQGLVVNDHDVLTEPEELVRLKKILDYNFTLIGKPVHSRRKKLGKIEDYAADSASFFVQKLYVSQSLFKSFTGGQLSVDRSQIIEITNRKIVISDPQKPIRLAEHEANPAQPLQSPQPAQ